MGSSPSCCGTCAQEQRGFGHKQAWPLSTLQRSCLRQYERVGAVCLGADAVVNVGPHFPLSMGQQQQGSLLLSGREQRSRCSEASR